MIPFDIKPVDKKLLVNVKSMVKATLNRKVVSGYSIGRGSRVKAIKFITADGSNIRLDIKYPPEITRLQIIASNKNIEIPKVLFEQGKYKFSEWIEGVMIKEVRNVAEVFIKAGDLMGRLNKVVDPITRKFITNGELSATNAVWTPDKKVYLIDQGRMYATADPDPSIVQVLLKRIREKERINLFLSAYSKHRNIDNILHLIEKRGWNWNQRKRLILNETKPE